MPVDQDQPTMPARLSRFQVVAFSTVAAVVLLVLAIIAMVTGWAPPPADVLAGQPILTQIVIGVICGAAGGLIVSQVCLRLDVLRSFRRFARQILADTRPTRLDVVYVSAIAGVSEEVLFRFVLQPLTGLLIGAGIFAVAHVGIPNSRAQLAFMTFVFVMGILLGTLFAQSGLVAAMIAHFVYDALFILIMMARLR